MLEKKLWQLQMSELEALTETAISAFIVEESHEVERRRREGQEIAVLDTTE